MLLLRGKGPKAPFALLTMALFLFGRRKPQEEKHPSTTPEPFPIPESIRKSVTEGDVNKARDRLRIASLERDIVSDALTKIYEAEAKGQLTEAERNTLVQRYKVDLKRVDGEIDTHKKTVDLHELESAKEDLLKSFYEKLMEIDARINQLRPVTTTFPTSEMKISPQTAPAPKTETTTSQPTTNRERTAKEKPKNKAEERLEAIREEVLKAMERLEQIETEG